MKKFKILVLCFLAFILAAPALTTKAAESYDIVFRAGGRGILTEGDGKKVVYNVPYGEKMPTAPGVEPEEGYFFNGWSESFMSRDVVTEKKIYVAKYLPIVSGLEYSVKYLDTNGNQLATPKMAMGGKESELIEEAIEIAGYTADAVVKSLTLSAGSTELLFVYTENQTETPPTEPATEETERQTQPQTNPPAPQPPNNNANNNANNNVNNTPTNPPTNPPANNTPADNENNEAGNEGNPVVPNEEQEDQGTVNIEDAEVPLANNPDNNTNGTETEKETFETENITDEEVPLAQNPETKADNFMLYIALFTMIVLGGGLGIRYAYVRRHR